MLTYEWKITGLKKTDDPSAELNDIIVQTYWQLTGTDEDGNSATFHGATPFEPDKVDPENFTTYENLTEAIAINWIKEVVYNNPSYKKHIDEQIQKQIDKIKNPIVELNGSNLPWAEPEVSAAPEPTDK